MDLGKLLVRLIVGGLMIGHGARKTVGWFGGPGLAATGRGLTTLGYRDGRGSAALAGVTEIGAGAGLVAGFLTPLAGAAVIGEMINAGAVHRHGGLWLENDGYEYTLVLAAVAAALAWDGPGRISADRALPVRLDGSAWGLGSIALGAASGALSWRILRQPDAG